MNFFCFVSAGVLPCSDNMMEDMDVDLEKEFLHNLKDLKVLINDKDMLDQHKRCACPRWVTWARI